MWCKEERWRRGGSRRRLEGEEQEEQEERERERDQFELTNYSIPSDELFVAVRWDVKESLSGRIKAFTGALSNVEQHY